MREESTFVEVMAPIVAKVVEQSFDGKQDRYPRREVKRRVDLCYDVVKAARFELKWSRLKIADLLPRIIRNKLDGLDFPLDSYGDLWSTSAQPMEMEVDEEDGGGEIIPEE